MSGNDFDLNSIPGILDMAKNMDANATQPGEQDLVNFLSILGFDSKVCGNCGNAKAEDKFVCPTCEAASNKLDQMLQQGIEIEYVDGSKTVLKK